MRTDLVPIRGRRSGRLVQPASFRLPARSAASQPFQTAVPVELIVNRRAVSSHFPRLMGRVRVPSLRRRYPAVNGQYEPIPPSASAGAGPHGFAVGMELSSPTTVADFPCCAPSHVPCVLPSLPRWNRQLRILARFTDDSDLPRYSGGSVSHIGSFEAFSMFTSRCGPHGPLTSPTGPFYRSASDHWSAS